MQEHERAVDM
jgi:hypothetical protein